MKNTNNFLDNKIPPTYRKALDRLVIIMGPVIIFIMIVVMFFIAPSTTFVGNIVAIIIVLSIAILIIIGHLLGYKIHPIAISFREEGIYLKRPSGKIKTIPWKNVAGLYIGKNARIITKYYPYQTPIYLFGEAKAEALYHFKKYGVKSNPKLKKVVEYIDRYLATQNLNQYLKEE